MKSLIFITTIFFSMTLCSTKRHVNAEVKTERFMQKAGDKSTNWLELVQE